MRYLVTGANGFIGRALCDALRRRGCQVSALLRRPAEGPWDRQIICDLAGERISADWLADIDGVFHLAGIAHVLDEPGDDPDGYQRVNVDGTRHLLRAVEAAGVGRVVFFSSVKAAADPPDECVDETWDAPPTDAYGRSKRAAERLLLARAGPSLHVCVLRPTLVYGAGVKGNLRRMIDAVAEGRFPPLPDLRNRRSMVGLDDLVEAAWLGMTRDAANGRIYIVEDGIDYATRDLYLAICQALGRTPPTWTLPLPLLTVAAHLGDLLSFVVRRRMPFSSPALERIRGSACYRSHRLRQELGWAPHSNFYDLLPDMLDK
ncbi:NAD-dependent epimerase/dehydratase family protein [Thiohalocapsa marina]|uniref:NAD-dependent epimerase/dehydratase family protein n=1 Tax=Thiohalocapsa marina TaxID=424902 RepID=A0A5M8FU32_9GAMM|nr:NAD-dependent epimerase/dehydratase family protein [Thiohalocapsa marina]KAA6187310.1 NAD-dependent epimerase/dehydratase family protein [Thiohalocapsa marina]